MYFESIFPFLAEGDFIKNTVETHEVSEIFCPLSTLRTEGNETSSSMGVAAAKTQRRAFGAFYVLPCNILVLNEKDGICEDIMNRSYGDSVKLNVITIDYQSLAKRVDVSGSKAMIKMNGAYNMVDNVVTDIFVNASANGSEVMSELRNEVVIPCMKATESLRDMLASTISEEVSIDDMIQARKKHKGSAGIKAESGVDYVYRMLDAYFKLPAGQDLKQGGREVVPLMIGPTGVFKSATVKELCTKYNYRLVDFRVAFTTRLDFSGLFKTANLDSETYSFSCPMEELVTCSDGFREYCRQALKLLNETLDRGYIVSNTVSDGTQVDGEHTSLTEEQTDAIKKLIAKYSEYIKPCVLFLDEITRCKDSGVQGVLTTLLNQKRFNNMTMYECKFVAATNLNLLSGNAEHDALIGELDDMYEVDTEIDVAYSNRFLPLKVTPDDVKGRWFEWAEGEKTLKNVKVKNIHPLIIEFLNTNKNLVYTDKPVLDAITSGKNSAEIRSQSYPNYRTWEMLSDYLYTIDREAQENADLSKNKKVSPMFRATIIDGLISKWAGQGFEDFLITKGYANQYDVQGKVNDDVGDFLSANMDAGVPAMLIGPSSLGKTSRVKAYMKKVKKETGLEPVLIEVSLAASDPADLMGMPSKKSLTDYVARDAFRGCKGLGSVGDALAGITKSLRTDHPEYGMEDTLTIRAANGTMKERFVQAMKDKREVILFFDECNRVKNKTVMSAMFEAISDQRIFGISYKSYKEHVKVIAACNLASTALDSDTKSDGYANAGEIDPALAARFSIYWKKQFDESDAKSWIDFMEQEKADGEIDGTLLEYVKSLPIKEVVKIMAKVEQRKIENAEPSTRAMLQLSKDILAMRGVAGKDGYKDSLYNGRVVFDDTMINTLTDLDMRMQFSNTSSIRSSTQDVVNFATKFLKNAVNWEPANTKAIVIIDGQKVDAKNLVDNIKGVTNTLSEMLLQPDTRDSLEQMSAYTDTLLNMLMGCNTLDTEVKNTRKKVFEASVGEEFANQFLPYFNKVYGTQEDVNITIEMLSDVTLIDPFISHFYAKISTHTSDQLVVDFLKLIDEFWNVHQNTLNPQNYSTLIRCIRDTMSSSSMPELLNKAGKSEDGVFAMAEKDTGFTQDVLRLFPGQFTEQDIENTVRILSGSHGNRQDGKRKSRIL